jgi:hypothetical protein
VSTKTIQIEWHDAAEHFVDVLEKVMSIGRARGGCCPTCLLRGIGIADYDAAALDDAADNLDELAEQWAWVLVQLGGKSETDPETAS